VELIPIAGGHEFPQPQRKVVQRHVGNRTWPARAWDRPAVGWTRPVRSTCRITWRITSSWWP